MPLPPGLVLNQTTGEVNGTPVEAGTFNFTLLLRDTLGTTREIEESIQIIPYVEMSADDIPDMATLGVAYNYVPNVQDGVSPYLYSISAGTLPDGLAFNSGTGEVTGTPTVEGDFLFTYTVTDAMTQTLDRAVIVAVRDTPTITSLEPDAMTVGVAYSWTATVTDGHPPYTHSFVAPLPPGLALDPSTGEVSGTPTADGSYAGTWSVTDAAGNEDIEVMTFNAYDPPELSGTLTYGLTGDAYNQSYTLSGGAPSPVWSHIGTLPPGLSINPSTGAITGTPTTVGTYDFTVHVLDSLGNLATRAASVRIRNPIVINGALSDGQKDVFYEDGLGHTGVEPVVWTITAGSLPPGITMHGLTGVLSGTCSVDATYNFTIRVTDDDGLWAEQAEEIIIVGELTITGDLTGTGTTTVAYSDSLGAIGGNAPYTFSKASGTLPTGLSLSSGGALTGTPTAAGTYNFTVRVTDSGGTYFDRAEQIVVAAFPSLTGTLPDATNGEAYSESLSLTGGHAPVSYSISSGSLPTGLGINASTGVISGTPTVDAASNFTVKVTDNLGNIATSAQTITVYPALSLTNNYGSTGYTGVSFTGGTAPTPNAAKAPISYVLAGGTLPTGLTLNASTGALTGTPTGSGLSSFTVRGSDGLGNADDIVHGITVVAKPSISNLASAPKASNGVAYNFTLTGTGGVAPYTFSGTLTKGLSLASNGAITGTATHSGSTGSTGWTVTITDANGQSQAHTLTITFAQAPTVSGDTSIQATRGVAFAEDYDSSFGHTPISFSITGGSLPSGLSISSSTGNISGTTTAAAGSYTFKVKATDSQGNTGQTSTVTLTLVNAMAFSGDYARGTVSEVYSSSGLSVTGGHAPITWSKQSGTLPTGLSLNSSTGALTGTPTSNGTYNFTIRATDASGQTKDSSESITIAAALTLSGTLADGTEDAPYSSTQTTSGGWPPYSYARNLGVGPLPPGLSLNASTGEVSGTPTTPGDYNVLIEVTDADGNDDSEGNIITIEAATPSLSVTISPSPASDSYDGFGENVTVDVSATATASGGSGSGYTYSWAYISGSSTMNTSGTATATCTWSKLMPTGGSFLSAVYRVTAEDSLGNTATKDVTVTLQYNDMS